MADTWRWVVTFRRPGQDTKVVYVSPKHAWSKDGAVTVARAQAPVKEGWRLEKVSRGRG